MLMFVACFFAAYPGQVLSKEKSDIKFDLNMPPNDKQEVMKKLRKAGVHLVNYGLMNLPNEQAKCRKIFNFARETGIEANISGPIQDTFGLIEKLCEEIPTSPFMFQGNTALWPSGILFNRVTLIRMV